MGLTLIEAAKYESRLEHLAVIKTFAEGELLSWLPFMNIAGGGRSASSAQPGSTGALVPVAKALWTMCQKLT
jgi:hypothetical protein